MSNKVKITKEMLILDILEQHPDLASVLTDDYGFHCVGCMAASMESLEDGAMVHGMTEKEIDKMMVKLNQKIEK